MIETYPITGVCLGFEFTPDPDYGGTALVIDFFIIRFIFSRGEQE